MLKRIISMVLALAICFGLAVPAASAAETKTYLVLGDSISAGVALENPGTEAFPVLLLEKLGGYGLMDMSESGETILSLLEKLGTDAYQASVAQADLMTITIGGNDLMALFYTFLAEGMGMSVEEVKAALGDGTDMEVLTEAAEVINSEENGFEITEAQISEIMANFQNMIAAIRAQNSTAVLVVATQYNPYKYLTGQVNDYYSLLPLVAPEYVPLADAILKVSGVIENALGSFNAAIQAGSNYGVADVYTVFDSRDEQLCNAALEMEGMSVKSVNMDFHPNAAGHKLIADCMAEAVQAELEKVPPATYTVSFHANGGTGEMAPVTNVSGSYTLPECTFTAPSGKEFSGWATAPDGEAITTAAIDVTMDITLYAIWTATGHPGGTVSVQRVSGPSRFDTAIAAANAMKDALQVEKFDFIILASGENFADALAGSYLGAVKQAPILLHAGRSQDVNLPYVQENLAKDGILYILGGSASVPEAIETDYRDAGIQVQRLSGDNRYLTNLAILEAAGVGDKEILIASGLGYADALSLSATGLPILLVNSNQTDPPKMLTAEQKAFLERCKGSKVTVIGGSASVSEDMKAAVEAVVGKPIGRICGENREETSVAIAKAYFGAPAFAVVASSAAFPDGLSGGPLAYIMHAPMLLTQGKDTQIKTTKAYIQEAGITAGYIMGGTATLSDDVVRAVFGMDSTAVIPSA